jgi:hypothetical protein
MEKDIEVAHALLTRLSSDYYRLSDYSKDRNGNERFSPEFIEAIADLGYCLDILSDLIEVEEDKKNMNAIIENSFAYD